MITNRFVASVLMMFAFSACANLVNDQSLAISQSTLKDQDPNAILFLKGEEQVAAFRNSSVLAPTRLIAAAGSPLALPDAATKLPTVSIPHRGRELSLDEYLTEYRVGGLIAVKNGEVVLERYGLGNSAESKWISFSVAKSVVSMLIGAAIKDGYITSLDQKVTDYLPQLKGSGYEQATIRNLLQMASGVDWNEDYADPSSDVAGANYETLALYEHLKQKRVVAPPGELFNYNTAETNLAGTLLRSAIGNNLSTYLQQKIWQPFGMESDAYWQLTEEAGGEFGGCCINATLRDYARLGLFALAEGKLSDGTPVLPERWMAESITSSKAFEGYGYFWWLEGDGSYQASGIFGQGIYINPATSTVIAVHSAWREADNEQNWELLTQMFKAIDDRMAID
ncbi:MAG: serine hydrolase domain-containing protein [Pseudomonadales bacterium]